MRHNNHGEFEQKTIDVRRVARVVAGGRRFSFRITSVVGNKKGEVGVGIGKAADVSSAMEKAFRNGKKNVIKPVLTKDHSMPMKIDAKFGSAWIMLRPTPKGKGLIAGSSVRTVLELAGIKNVTAKVLSRSKNKINNARAAIKALKMIK